jgi:hypothetical protein
VLDERCASLRKTAGSLRDSRRSLHGRVLAYLQSPSDVAVSREHMLSQTRTLSDLDASIDEWAAKLEAAEARRTLIRQKLLQHAASVLSLSLEPGHADDEQTPPTSPERAAPPDVPTAGAEQAAAAEGAVAPDAQAPSPRPVDRRASDAESIKIYADSGVAGLLASIDQEIEMLDQQMHDRQAERLLGAVRMG